MNDNPKPAEPSAPASSGPQVRTASTRSFKRLCMVVAGLLIVVCGALYSWWSGRQSEEVRGWEAYLAKKDDEAIAHFSEAIQQRPKSAEAYAGRSWAEVAKRQWQKALADSTEALRLDPKMAKAHIAKANALAALDKIDEAMLELNEAIRCDPNSGSAYYFRARIGYDNSVKDAKPLADVAEAIRLDPDFAGAYTLQGCIECGQKRYDAAIAACDKALARDPRDALALRCRGEAHLGKGEVTEGAADLRQAQNLEQK